MSWVNTFPKRYNHGKGDSMAIMDSRFIQQQPNPFYVPEQEVYLDLSPITDAMPT